MRLRDEHGTNVELSKVLGKGGEAEVWAVSTHTSSVAKIYHVPSAGHESKLRAMVAQPPVDPTRNRGHVSICWPQALLFDPASRKNLGFLMPRIDLSQHRELFKIYNARTRRSEAPDFTWAYLVTAAENIANVIESIHARGYVVGDMNESNFFISSSALATIVDCDSMQVTNGSLTFRCTVAKPEYMAPELQGKSLAKEIRTQPQDNFALAVLLFHLLMEGFHPYSGKWNKAGEAPSIEERISTGDSPYGSSSRISPSPGAPPFDILPAPIRALFVRAFYQGNRDPDKRPSAREWQQALHILGTQLSTCKVNPQHQFSAHLSRCPWCDRTVLLQGFDPFPSPAAQKAMPSRPFQSAPAAQPIPPRPPVPPPTRSAPSSVKASPQATASLSALAYRTVFRVVVFLIPFLAAFLGLLLLRDAHAAPLPLLLTTWMLAAGLGVAARLRLRRSPQPLLTLPLWALTFFLLVGLPPLGASYTTLLRSLAEPFMAFLASRSLLRLFRLRMDHYRLVGHTGRLTAVLLTSLAIAPLAALTSGAPSFISYFLGEMVARAPAAAHPAASVANVTVYLCATVTGHCGCAAKTIYHHGETVNLLLISQSTPNVELQVEPPGSLPTRVTFSNWRTDANLHCAVGQYKISRYAPFGFSPIHILVSPGTRNQTRSETGFDVFPQPIPKSPPAQSAPAPTPSIAPRTGVPYTD